MEISQADLAYAAGLIDGEGTITLGRKHSSCRFRSPIISMSSTTVELVNFMKSTFGGCISNHKTYQSHHKSSYSWRLSYDKAIEIMSLLIPFLREPEKRRRVLLILSTYKSVTKRNGKYPLELEVLKFQFEQEFFHPSTP